MIHGLDSNLFEREPANQRPLPTDLQAVDDLLAREARHLRSTSTPAGLAQRVFEATVDLLPNRREAPLQPLASIGPRSVRWGRLAMAASVVLAGMVWTALFTPASLAEQLAVINEGFQEFHDEAIHDDVFGKAPFDDMTYLLTSHETTSDHLERELATMADELEM